MKKVSFLILCIVILMVIKTNAQSQFNIDYNEMKGKLTKTDKFQKDFGRYHGYELQLYEGETANIMVHSTDFGAKLILVDPNGKVYKQSPDPTNDITSIITPIPISGDWILYVVGNQKDEGQFILRYAFANQNSLYAPANMDLCSTLNYLIAHANANFMMLSLTSANDTELPKLPGTIRAFLDSSTDAYVNILSSSDDGAKLENLFANYSEQLLNCLPDWKKVKNMKKGIFNLQFKNEENIFIDLEYNTNLNQNNIKQLTLRISK